MDFDRDSRMFIWVRNYKQPTFLFNFTNDATTFRLTRKPTESAYFSSQPTTEKVKSYQFCQQRRSQHRVTSSQPTQKIKTLWEKMCVKVSLSTMYIPHYDTHTHTRGSLFHSISLQNATRADRTMSVRCVRNVNKLAAGVQPERAHSNLSTMCETQREIGFLN